MKIIGHEFATRACDHSGELSNIFPACENVFHGDLNKNIRGNSLQWAPIRAKVSHLHAIVKCFILRHLYWAITITEKIMYQLTSLEAECRSYAHRLTQNKVLAEDLVQEALKRYLDNDSSVRNREGYIKRTIHNLYMNSLRKEKKHRVYVLSSLNTEPPVFFPTSTIETNGELDQLFSLMQNILTPHERAVFIMKKSFEKEYESEPYRY